MVANTEHAGRSGCPVACAMDIFGDHWSLLVIRDLAFSGRHEYKDLLRAEEGISSNILSNRLRRLEDNGLITALPHPGGRRRKLYYLTDRGKDLIPVLISIMRWSERHLGRIVKISPANRRLLTNDPDHMIRSALQELERWEKSVGI